MSVGGWVGVRVLLLKVVVSAGFGAKMWGSRRQVFTVVDNHDHASFQIAFWTDKLIRSIRQALKTERNKRSTNYLVLGAR